MQHALLLLTLNVLVHIVHLVKTEDSHSTMLDNILADAKKLGRHIIQYWLYYGSYRAESIKFEADSQAVSWSEQVTVVRIRNKLCIMGKLSQIAAQNNAVSSFSKPCKNFYSRLAKEQSSYNQREGISLSRLMLLWNKEVRLCQRCPRAAAYSKSSSS